MHRKVISFFLLLYKKKTIRVQATIDKHIRFGHTSIALKEKKKIYAVDIESKKYAIEAKGYQISFQMHSYGFEFFFFFCTWLTHKMIFFFLLNLFSNISFIRLFLINDIF